ncbi:cytochrome C [Ramlibacter sp. AW1]|uniref:Cytochrome C n=1 Tax=Ramlibacter aurantiacus TaxID=2801330 RepID=A0A936ZGT4_9BURK|nr:c-type cytochrome [Ramlibacter aurantiacus]MBL0420657.1 cytochrome C [Ramlibacter aurantiacus]
MSPRSRRLCSFVILLSGTIAGAASAQGRPPAEKQAPGDRGSIERGRYLAKIAGCNDCHTPNYGQSGGKVPEAQWLTGDKLGFRGAWGTTYPANLRLMMQRMSEAEWLKMARTHEMRPPMPWFNLRDMSTQDLRSLYRFVRHLGPAGEPAPEYLPPGQQPQGPVVSFPM